MRKKFVYIVLVPAFVFLAILYFFLDGWVESGLEFAGESLVGAKVEIDDLRLTLIPVGIEFSRLQVADPRDTWTNTVETGSVAFAMDFDQLLRGKFIIETMEVNELIVGTRRSTDGSLGRPPPPESPFSDSTQFGAPLAAQSGKIAKEKEAAAPMFDLSLLRAQLNVDSLLDTKNLRSARHLDSLERQINQASEQWRAALADIDRSRARAAEIEQIVKGINVNELKGIDKIVAAIKSVSEAYGGVKEITETFTTHKQSLTEGVNRLSASVRSIDDVVREDYQRLVAAAKLPDVGMRGLAELLLGNDVLSEANKYLAWVDFAKQNIRNTSSKPENEKPSRSVGQTIHFSDDQTHPKFWIKKILVSGGTDRERNPEYFYAMGEILNVASDQRITGVPITVDLTAEQGRGTTAAFTASLDRTKDLPVDTYKATLNGVPISAMQLGRSDFVPSKITNARAGFLVQAIVPGNRFDADAQIALRGITVQFERDPRNTVERLVRDVLRSITEFGVKIRLWTEGGPLKVAFETDLDNLLAERTRRVIGEEVTRIRNDLKAKLDEKIRAKRTQVEVLLNGKRGEVLSRLQTYENQIKEKLAVVENKKAELENEKKKQEDALKKKAGDVLKGIFKKN